MALVSFTFFWMAGNTVTKSNKDVERYDAKIKTTLEKLNSAMLMDEQLEGFSEIINNSLTTKDKFSVDELNEFKIRIDKLRDDNRMKLIKISDANKFTEAGLIETTYNMELEGSFQQAGQFLSELEKLKHIIKIQYLDISPSQISGKDADKVGAGINKYRITLEMSIFKAKKEA